MAKGAAGSTHLKEITKNRLLTESVIVKDVQGRMQRRKENITINMNTAKSWF